MTEIQTNGQKVFSLFNYCILGVTSLLCILPFINLLAISLSGSAAVTAGKVAFWPVEFTMEPYFFAFRSNAFPRALGVSAKRVLLGVGTNLLPLILTAYPLSRPKEKLWRRNLYVVFFVITMIINGGMIPTYLVLVNLGLLDNIWSLILPGTLPVYNMIILMNFIRTLPQELEEAAMIDGAGACPYLQKYFTTGLVMGSVKG